MTLVYGIIILILLLAVGGFGGASFKRSKNTKLCQGGYYCILIGPDRVWMKVLPADNGLIVQPTGDALKKFYKKNEPQIPWATDGYIVPKEGPVPTVPWPVEASNYTQTTVGMLIYHVGCSMPMGYDKDGKFIGYGTISGAAPEIIAALYKSRDTVQLFRQAATENQDTPQTKQHTNIWNIITLIGVAAVLILCIIIYMAVTSGFTHINNGFGI